MHIKILKLIFKNSINLVEFIKRVVRIFPPILDQLDIFHIQWAKTLLKYPELVESLECPVLLSLRGTHINVSPLSDDKLTSSYKKYFPQINGFHAVSKSIAIEACKYGADMKKIKIINPAVTKTLLNYKSFIKKKSDYETLKIISVGRCHWIKGYTFALDAMAILKKENINFHYTIIASGIDRENIFYQISDLDLCDHVTFINGLSHERTLHKIYDSDIFLLPSLGEGISNSILEAMALGIPVFSSNCGGMEEVITDRLNGFIFPARESFMMAELIKQFINLDKKVVNSIILNAKNTINENYLLSKQIDKFIQLYNYVR